MTLQGLDHGDRCLGRPLTTGTDPSKKEENYGRI